MNALTGELVGLDEVNERGWWSYFDTTRMATLDERDDFIRE